MADKYNLNWRTFSEHLQLMFKDLHQEGRYTDVTLISDDQTQFKAHKIVLSACSPVFKKIIDNNPTQHPLIYLRGIHSYEMDSILQFMYLGEARSYQERMEEFVKVAKGLEVKEISDIVEKWNDGEEITEKFILKDEFEVKEVSNTVINDREKETVEEDVQGNETNATLKNNSEGQKKKPKTLKSLQCPECGVVYKYRADMLKHHRSKHEGVKFNCNQCDYQTTYQSNLHKHIKSLHEGIKHPCNHCEYQATSPGNLRTHIKAIHEGVKYSCDQCDHQFTQKSSLRKHIEVKHNHILSQQEGTKYPCNHCDYLCSTKSSLKIHIESKHEGKRYPCSECEYQATAQSSLRTHIAAKHSNVVLYCEKCDFQTKWPKLLYIHKKTHASIQYNGQLFEFV